MNNKTREIIETVISFVFMLIGIAFIGLMIFIGMLAYGCKSSSSRPDPCASAGSTLMKNFPSLMYDRCGQYSETQMYILAQNMKVARRKATNCFNRSYGRSDDVPYIMRIDIQEKTFKGKADGKMKDVEFQPTSRVMRFHPTDNNLYNFVGELHTIYRINAFGYSNIYNRSIPDPESPRRAQNCVESWRIE